MKELKVGDLVRDKLNHKDHSYGLGGIVDDDIPPSKGESWDRMFGALGKKYSVYFTKFGKTITFHGDYLERVSED